MADSCSHCIWSLRTGNSLWHWQAHICNSSSTISIVILHDLLARAYRGLCCQFREAINCVFPASTGPTDTIQTFSVCRDRFVHLLSEALPSSLILRVAFLIIFTFVSAGPILFQCNPVAAAWNFSLRAPPFGTGTAKCMDLNVFIKFGVFNSCTFLSLTKCMKHYLPCYSYQCTHGCVVRRAPCPHDLDTENQYPNENLPHWNLESRLLVSF